MTISFIQAVPLSTSPAIEVNMVASVCLSSIAPLQSGYIVTVTWHLNSIIVKIVTLIILTLIIIISMTMMTMLIMVMMVIMTFMIMAIVMMI